MRAQQSAQNEPCPPPKPILVCVHSFHVRLQTIIQSLIVAAHRVRVFILYSLIVAAHRVRVFNLYSIIVAAHRVLEVLLGDGLAGAERVVEHLLEAPSARA